MYRKLWVIGSVGFDHIMRMPGRYADFIMPQKIDQLNVSFTVDTFRKEFGGTGGNCAYTLGLLGEMANLVATFGDDSKAYRSHLEQVGVNLDASPVVNQPSAQGFVTTDRDNNQIWSYYPGALKNNFEISLKAFVTGKDLVALLPSDPVSFVTHMRELKELQADYVFDPAFFIPNLTVEELKVGIDHARVIIGNEYEIALLEKKTSSQLTAWVKHNKIVVRTLGSKGAELFVARKHYQLPAARIKRVVDPTGAGDAFRAGFLAGMMSEKPWRQCVQMGLTAAAYAVESLGTQTHQFSQSEFDDRLEENFNSN